MIGINPKQEYPYKVCYSMNGVSTNSKVFKTEKQADNFCNWVWSKGGDYQKMWGEPIFA